MLLAKGEEVDWFNEEMVRRVSNGATTNFWEVAWRGEVPFMLKFHRRFTISINQEATVQDMWSPNLSGGRWVFNWRRHLFVWENNLLIELLGIWKVLCGVVRRIGGCGSWRMMTSFR